MPVFRPLSMGIVLGFLPLTILGQRQLVHVALPAKQTVERRLVAPSGDFVELCTSVRAGRVITWRFEATAPLAFHTHFHVDGDVRAPESMSAVTAAQGRPTSGRPPGSVAHSGRRGGRRGGPVGRHGLSRELGPRAAA